MNQSNTTPMLRQYQELKQQHPGTLLFFRLGDFYELFFDDALTGSRELQITLTARHKETEHPVPMCGVPHHSAANYIARLVRKGYRVAICEQTEEAGKTKKLVRREVVRIVTPGTPIDPQLLEAREPVFLAAVCSAGETIGAAFLDISTGEFRVTQETGRDSWTRIRAARAPSAWKTWSPMCGSGPMSTWMNTRDPASSAAGVTTSRRVRTGTFRKPTS